MRDRSRRQNRRARSDRSGRAAAQRNASTRGGRAQSSRGDSLRVVRAVRSRGQTPPCAFALVEAGVKRVVVACLDPDPRVKGRGIAILKRAGIEVTTGVLSEDAQCLNSGFITRVMRGRPAGILKLCISLDGRIADANGDWKWISSEPSRELVHRWRRECDAVMVGAGTVSLTIHDSRAESRADTIRSASSSTRGFAPRRPHGYIANDRTPRRLLSPPKPISAARTPKIRARAECRR